MKNISQNVVSHSERFLQNISKALPDEVESFSLESFGMCRAGGYGQYKYVMECDVNGESTVLKMHSTDSLDFDLYGDLEYQSRNFNNWVKRRVLWMLSVDFINDNIL